MDQWMYYTSRSTWTQATRSCYGLLAKYQAKLFVIVRSLPPQKHASALGLNSICRRDLTFRLKHCDLSNTFLRISFILEQHSVSLLHISLSGSDHLPRPTTSRSR